MNEINEQIIKKQRFLNRIATCSFSDAFTHYLKYEGLTSFDVASEAEISKRTVDRYCYGISCPTITTLLKIFIALHTSYDICEVLFAKANITVSDNMLQSTVYRTLLENDERIDIEDANRIIDFFNKKIQKPAEKIKVL